MTKPTPPSPPSWWGDRGPRQLYGDVVAGFTLGFVLGAAAMLWAAGVYRLFGWAP